MSMSVLFLGGSVMKHWEKYIGAALLSMTAVFLIWVHASGEDFMKKLGELGVSKYIEAMKTQEDFQEQISKSSGTATIFVPNDAAINSWSDFGNFMKPENKRKMRRFLKHSVILGDLTVEQCVQKERHITADGTEVTIKKEGGDIVVIGGSGKAKIIKTDVKFSNGYINVIDSVLLPKDI